MTCIQCGETSKYKCPTCQQPYCSVACFKEHKQTPCLKPTEPPRELDSIKEPTSEYDHPTEDTVPLHKLKLLEQSAGLKKCLEEPYMRELLETLDKAYNPDSLIQEYMQEPIFTEFVDACLKVVQPVEEDPK
ncbi:Zinc finger HIT domain-containing protein 3 [Operophtera brumata]|uniref:Zinc finger HIT domain-containing protein 3 n=1 Tax=Operophtera brumata TaxID=104452 RepID=A0A0L7KNB8_OPEBR|nr:Zinc finger HIT domain-containing protein 3 [Operophtera brumata]